MKVKFLPQNVEYEIRPGQSVLELAQEKGVHIRSTCNGLPSCAECRIRVTEGDYNVMPPTTKELNLIGTGYFLDQRRLSCQLQCFGDVTIDTSEHVGKEGEGAVTKQFLQRVQKGSAEQTNSVNGVLIEQDAELLNSVTVQEEAEPRQQQRHHHKTQNQNQNQSQKQGGGGGQGHNQRRHKNNNQNQRRNNNSGNNNPNQQNARAGGQGGGGQQRPRPQNNNPRPQNQNQNQNRNNNTNNSNSGGKPS